MKRTIVVSSTVYLMAAAGAVAFSVTQYGGMPAAVRAPVAVIADARSEDVAVARNPLPTAETKPPTARLLAVGDVMLSRVVGQKMAAHGAAYPFDGMREWLASGDVVFANLETSITPGRPVKTGEMSFRADPAAAPALKEANVTVVSLANNHAPNFGAKGLRDTFAYLRDAGVEFVGAGENRDAAFRPAAVERGGVSFAFLAFNDTDVVPASYGAGEDRPGTAFMDAGKMAEAVAGARGHADVVIVSMHSGTEYVPRPNARQVAFAHAAIDAGADVVIGHHPHVVQTAENYEGKWIFYSLGNFIFDQMWSRDTREGLALALTVAKDGVKSVELVPVLIEDYAQPRPYAGPGVEALLGRLGQPFEKTADGAYMLVSP